MKHYGLNLYKVVKFHVDQLQRYIAYLYSMWQLVELSILYNEYYYFW